MALINCSECGRKISNKATCCPGCGVPLSAQEIEQTRLSEDIPTKLPTQPNRDDHTDAGYGTKGIILMLISVVLVLWGILLVLDTIFAMTIMFRMISFIRFLFGALIIFVGVRAWKAGRNQKSNPVI